MSALSANDSLDFNSLKDLLDVTDGNLATHIKRLEHEEFIEVQKTFIDNKPNTSYSVTPKGKKAFEDHLSVMESIIRSQKS